MADFPYLQFAIALNSGYSFDPLTATIGYVLVNETVGGTIYTPNEDTDTFLSDIVVGARIASGTLSGVTRTSNLTLKRSVVAANNQTLALVSGPKVDAIVFYVDTGTAGTSRLICHYSTWGGLPWTAPNGPLTINLPTSADKLFSIGKL